MALSYPYKDPKLFIRVAGWVRLGFYVPSQLDEGVLCPPDEVSDQQGLVALLLKDVQQ